MPQQFHLEIMVEDVAAAEPRVLELGAVKLNGENVYADPQATRSASSHVPAGAPPIPVVRDTPKPLQHMGAAT